eukprot:CAMPEP_0197913904 /NCGR_PEP_ID=MMETSP1439-20131203/77467_1 /TAXON_ID=66791 /ORGANISM="Gonyaulax spinifera, Strain CCMP409" /LENGTH=55 /DNA_ID=CAMNT_0043535787 /DNA_START=61 /DNA_END=224 /DNA_ORIENTATION=-
MPGGGGLMLSAWEAESDAGSGDLNSLPPSSRRRDSRRALGRSDENASVDVAIDSP